jgi:hypothetical protein
MHSYSDKVMTGHGKSFQISLSSHNTGLSLNSLNNIQNEQQSIDHRSCLART